jgi:SNF2 family DNA or RNA helicase
MLSNQLDPENTFECIPTTLVVAPLALLKQWEIEIEQKVGNKRFDVLVYNAPQRFRKQRKPFRCLEALGTRSLTRYLLTQYTRSFTSMLLSSQITKRCY